eukprot:scaffold4736_cov105-Cylindrotheca_fusiformis.AAC.6
MMNFAVWLLLVVISYFDSQSIFDLAEADGKYETFLDVVSTTPGVFDAITDSFPVSKYTDE